MIYIKINEIIKAINSIGTRDWLDYLNLILSIITIILSIGATFINIWLVNKNTNKQIENQNRETYRPRLRLKTIKVVAHNSDEKYLYAYSKDYESEKNSITLYADIELENIGNGIANDLTFYMINSGDKCLSIQTENKEVNQVLNSTLEIPKDKMETIKFIFKLNKDKLNDEDFLESGDAILLVCNYKDLNNNDYKILIGYILKKYEPFKVKTTENGDFDSVYSDAKFDIYYYQEETDEYKGMVGKDIYSENYKVIIEKIKNQNI